MPISPTQTAPGRYEQTFEADAPGNYVLGLAFTGQEGERGQLRGGTSVNSGPELRELASNYANIEAVARRTGGRVLDPFDPDDAGLFDRQWVTAAGVARALPRTSSPTPVWDLLIPVLVALVLLDVAARRIAWDWLSTKTAAANAAERVRAFTLAGSSKAPDRRPVAKPDPAARREQAARKFEATGVGGSLADVTGGATAKPVPKDRAGARPKVVQGERKGEGGMSSLMEAKRRAREKIEREREG